MTEYEVAEYMVKLDGAIHPAMLARPGTGIIFDGKQKRWVHESDGTNCIIPYDDIYQATFEARDALVATCNKYREGLEQPLLDTNANHDWTEVEDSVQAACTGLEKLASKDKDLSGSLGRLRRAFRGLCKNAGAGRTAANLIPNDSFGFTSVLCGSLKVVFTGLQTTGLHRLEVYRTLEDLPQRLKDIAADVSMHNRDHEIHRRAAALYVATFKLLNHILLWFLRSNIRTGMKLLIDPTGFMDRLRDCQAELKIASQSFEARLNRLSRDIEQETLQLSYSSAYSVHTQLQTITEAISQEREARIDIMESLKPFLKMVIDVRQEKEILAARRPKRTKRTPHIEPEAILDHFLYEPDLVVKDCAKLATRAKESRRTSSGSGRLVALQINPRLQAWLTMDESALLFLNGRAEPRPDSAVSFFTAQLFQSLLEHHRTNYEQQGSAVKIIPLGFFCGQHRDEQSDANGSPEEMAMSLLLQLVDRCRRDLDDTILRQCYESTRGGSVDSICSMFEVVVASLSHKILVVIIVDGMRFFAQPPTRALGSREVVSRLISLCRSELTAKVKMLFSSPTNCDYLEDLFEDDESLAMPREIASGRTDSARKFRSALEANLEAVADGIDSE